MDEESRGRGTTPAAPQEPAGPVPPARAPAVGETAPGAPAASETVPGAPARSDAERERQELERLRAEVADLRGRAAAGPASRRGRDRWRAPVSAVLIVLACILAPVTVLSVWAANQVSNTDRFVANMQPLIREPAIQSALSARITTQIESRINVPALVGSTSAQLSSAHLPRLATLLQTFSGQIASGVDSLIHTTVSQVIASPAVATAWVTALRTAHTGVVKVLSGQGNGSLSVVNNQVVLNIGPLITQVKDTLLARGLTIADRIPAINATYPLFQAPNLAKAQQGYRLITTLKWVLPLLTIALLVAGVWVARKTRHALYWAALGVAASMLVLGIALTIGRSIYLNSLPSGVSSDAAAVAYDTLIRFIRQGLRVLFLVGLIVAAGAFLTGPSSAAVATRHAIGSGIGWIRERAERRGVHAGPVGEWTAAHKTLLRVAAVGVVALIFVFWGHPTLAVVIWLLVLLLAALGVIELLGGGRPSAAAGEAATTAAPGP